MVEMAAKRFFPESGSDLDHPNEKRARTRPTFASYATDLSISIRITSALHICIRNREFWIEKYASSWSAITIFCSFRSCSIIGEVVMANSLQNFCTALEPMLRRVVK